MVSRRRYRSSPGLKLSGLLFLSLAALALASGTYLNTPRVPVRATVKPVLPGIAPIYRQISAQAEQASPVPGSIPPASMGGTFGAAFLRIDGYAQDADLTEAIGADSPASGPSVGGITVSMLGGRWLPSGVTRRLAMPEDLSGAAAMVFNSSFSSLFSRIFRRTRPQLKRRLPSRLPSGRRG